jgi:hypothetical protein
MSDKSIKLKREKITLMMTIERTDGDFLSVEDAKAFADALLVERNEQRKWSFDGSDRLNYNRVKIYYVHPIRRKHELRTF